MLESGFIFASNPKPLANRLIGLEFLLSKKPKLKLSQANAIATLGCMKALVLKDEQFVTDAKGNRVGVLLDVKTYERLREAEEELADIRAYDAARPKAAADVKAGRVSGLSDYRAKRFAKRK